MKTMHAWVLSMMMLMIMLEEEEEWGERGPVRALRGKTHVCSVFSCYRSLMGDGGEGGG